MHRGDTPSSVLPGKDEGQGDGRPDVSGFSTLIDQEGYEMLAMTRAQIDEFLTGGRHIMKLATLTTEGWSYVNPVWYEYDGDAFLVAGRRRARWVANIGNDRRISACVDTPDAPYSRVLVEGEAEVIDGSWLGEWEHWAVRYLGQEAGHRYYEETRHIPGALIRIMPSTITSWAGPGWHPRYTE